MLKRLLFTVCLAVAVGQTAWAQPLFTDAIPKEEFAERRARVAQRIGDAVAILQGVTELPGLTRLRQNNQFFYLTGVEVTRAIVVIDGRAKSTTLFLPPRDERLERSEGPVLVPGEQAATLTGIKDVLPRDQFAGMLMAFAQQSPILYTPFRPEALGAAESGYAVRHAAASVADPWDGRLSREAAFIQQLRHQVPEVEIRNLDPILDEMRVIKSPREIALIREATRIGSLGIMEAMRSTAVGMYEYQLEAVSNYVFQDMGAQGFAYFALIAAGPSAVMGHYHSGQTRLKDGDLVLWDYGPDYKYYTSDITRMIPASGRFSAEQRELYGIYLLLYKALMQPIRVNAAPRDIIRDAVTLMDQAIATYRFTNPKFKQAAQRFADRYRPGTATRLGHFVGLEVHDVTAPFDVLKPGMVFTIEPALTIPEDGVNIRCEDTLLITETGYENLSRMVPLEIADIEKLMTEPGLGKRKSTTMTVVPQPPR